ncbi:MAG: hypothetical protein CMM50_01700 [Rhodospirillaceae bacterium]|nr:hypothetical protein [Rhodospirillaceae bacterium]
MEYYIVRDGEAVGPFSEDALAELAAGGELVPQTLVWTEGMTDWAEAGSVSELGRALKGEKPASPVRAPSRAEETADEIEKADDEAASGAPDSSAADDPLTDDSDAAAEGSEPVAEDQEVSVTAAGRADDGDDEADEDEEAERARAARARRARQQDAAAATPRWILPYARKPGTVPYRIDDGLREGWNAWKLHPIRALLAILLYVLVVAAISVIPYIPQVTEPIDAALGASPQEMVFDESAFPQSPAGQFRKAIAEMVFAAQSSPAALILGVIVSLLSYVLVAGLVVFHLWHVRGGRVSAFAVLSGFRRPISVIVATILVWIVVVIGSVLFVLPGIWLMVKFMFVPMAIIDQKLGPIAGMKASWRATRALGWWQCFGILLASGLVAVLGILGVFVGFLVTLSIGMAALGAAYDTALANGRGR